MTHSIKKDSLALLAAVLSCLFSPRSGSGASANVSVGNNFFSPATTNINAGDQVIWTWESGSLNHNVVSTSSSPAWLFPSPGGGPGTTANQDDSNLRDAPFSFTNTFSTAGSFPFECTEHVAMGMIGSIDVKAANPTPAVSIISPASGATFTAPADVSIQVSASVSAGTVTNVEFFAGTTLLDSVQTSPFNFAASNLAQGNYSLTAVATAAGVSATSAVVSISVVAAVPVSNSPPVIIEQPQSQTVPANTAVTFSVTASNATSYQWQSNMVDMPGQTNDSLAFSNVVVSDSAAYRVVVSNATASVISSNAVLMVLAASSPVITVEPQSTNAVTNTTVTFFVIASNAGFYQWESNLVDLAGATNASLTLSNVVPADAGGYQVVISNAAGSVTSSVAVLSVGFPVIITQQPASATVPAGTPVTLEVLATGLPAPQLQWALNNLNLPGQTNADLVLEAATTNMAGTYSVIVSNLFGSQTSSQAVLTVTPLPHVTKEKLAVKINPANSGAVGPNLNGASLIVAHSYTVNAVAHKGQAFANWSGIVQSDSPSLTFIMPDVSNATLWANFIPSPFAGNGVAGAYAGLFWDTNNPSNESSGWFSATLADNGVMDGLVKIAGVSTTFATTFQADGTVTVGLKRPNLGSLVLTLLVELTGTGTMRGTVADASNTFKANLTAFRAGFSPSNPATLDKGYYTWAMPGAAGNAPAGYSYGTATIAAAGGVGLTLFLSDGTAATASGALSTNGQMPLYVSLYGGKGSLLCWLSFTNSTSVLSTNAVYWFKNPVTKGFYPDGFNLTNLPLWMGAYTAEAKGINGLDATTVSVQLSAADLTNSIAQAIALNSSGFGGSTTNISVNVSDKTGLFRGSFKDPSSGKKVPLQGALLRALPAGYGFFNTSAGLSGAVVIAPP